MRHHRAFTIVAVAVAGIGAAPAHAAGMTFDCDAPSGRIASLTGQIGAAVRATGTISAVAFQSGKPQAIGGLLVNSSDGLNSVGFQLVLARPDARALDLVVIARNAGKPERRVLGSVPFGTAVPFAIVLPAGGQGSFTLGTRVINLAFANLKSGTAMAFCTSGQFRFDDLQIATG